MFSTNINIDRSYNTQEVSSCIDQILKITNNLFHSQFHLSQVSSSSKIKHVTPTSVKSNSTISNVLPVNIFITERLRILYTLWKIPVVIENCFNEFSQHDRKVEPDNDDINRNNWGKLLFGHFLDKHELLSEDDMHTTFNFLSFDTFKKSIFSLV